MVFWTPSGSRVITRPLLGGKIPSETHWYSAHLEALGILAHFVRMVMEPKYLGGDDWIHPNLKVW